MKTTTFLIFFFLLMFGTYSFAQDNLDYNNVNALILDEGVLFKQEIGEGYEIPKGSGKGLIYSSGFWLAGYSQDDTLRTACARFNQGRDFFSGPYSTNGLYFDQNYINLYDNAIWTVTRDEIENHLMNFDQPNYVIPLSISSWPGNGNVSLGIANNLAPFIDSDWDGIYEPEFGEVPDIRGDMASYVIMNDAAGLHTESNGFKLDIELHLMLFQYTSNNFLDNTTFVNLRVFNRGPYIFDDLRVAFYLDGDVGNYSDDYMGTDTLRNMIYTYNGDNLDDGFGYGENPPALGVVSLNYSIAKTGFYTSDSQYPYTDPTIPIEYWNYINGYWSNGEQWHYGGLGYLGSTGSTSQPTSFMFPGDPLSGLGWSELSAPNNSGDRRMFMALESANLNSDIVPCFDFAIIYSRTGNHLENVQSLKSVADSVLTFFEEEQYSCRQVTAAIEILDNMKLKVYPNPSDGKFNVEVPKVVIGEQVFINDINGRLVWASDSIQKDCVVFEISLESGIYFLSIGSNTFLERIIIN